MPAPVRRPEKPTACVACEGTGRSSNNGECRPCEGTGVQGGKRARTKPKAKE